MTAIIVRICGGEGSKVAENEKTEVFGTKRPLSSPVSDEDSKRVKVGEESEEK
jgi:hypothetical protein